MAKIIFTNREALDVFNAALEGHKEVDEDNDEPTELLDAYDDLMLLSSNALDNNELSFVCDGLALEVAEGVIENITNLDGDTRETAGEDSLIEIYPGEVDIEK